MAVTSARWYEAVLPDDVAGYDIHVVATGGASRRLDRFLLLDYDVPDPADPTKTISQQKSAASALADGIKVVFEAQCTLGPPIAGTSQWKLPSLNNATFDTASGEVVYPAAVAGANILRNFIVLARITDQHNVAYTPPPAIRIHLHPGIVKIWPTPSPLTVHQDLHPVPSPLTRPRFRLLAEFSDDTLGDVTQTPGIQWTSRDPAKVTVGPQGQLKALVPDAAGVAIQITLPASLLSTQVSDGLVNTKPPWKTPVAAHIIGHASGAARLSKGFNFLFLSEGFVDGEQDQFQQLALALADFIHNTHRTYPYNLLKDRINFWWAFVPSPKAGTTVLYENMEAHDATHSLWLDVSARPSVTRQFAVPIDKLIREAGLPAPADQTALTTPDQITAWNKLFGAFAPDLAAANDVDVTWWRLMANRFLLDDVDSAFGLVYGERPRQQSTTPARSIALSPIRCGRADLDDFLGALTDGPGGVTIGDTWAKKDAPDRPFVIFLCAGAREGGARSPGDDVLAIGLPERTSIDATIVPGHRRATLNPEAPGSKVSIDNEVTVAHEMAHALGIAGKIDVGLDDEYGEFLASASPTADQLASIKTYPNIQSRVDLLGGGAVLKGDQIKWAKWQRIEKAALLDLPPVSLDPLPVQVGSRFRLVVKAPPPRPFAAGDKVRLRKRPLSTAPDPTLELQVTTIESKTSMVVKVLTLPFDPSTIAIGDIVFKARHGTVGGASVELKLVSQAIQDHVTATNRPLNAPKPPAGYTCAVTNGDPMDPTNRPAEGPTFKLPRYMRWVVGLYDGGAQFNCDVYHPSGICIMRRQQRAASTSADSIYAFCPVCRYALVDNLDPTLHGTVDDVYQTIWPEP